MNMFFLTTATILLAAIAGSLAMPYYGTSTTPAPSPGQSTPAPSPGQSTPAPSACCACDSASPSPSPISLQTCALDCGEEDSGTLSGLEDADIYTNTTRRFLRDVVKIEHRELGVCIRTPFAGGRVRFIGCNTANIALIPEDSDGVFG